MSVPYQVAAEPMIGTAGPMPIGFAAPRLPSLATYGTESVKHNRAIKIFPSGFNLPAADTKPLYQIAPAPADIRDPSQPFNSSNTIAEESDWTPDQPLGSTNIFLSQQPAEEELADLPSPDELNLTPIATKQLPARDATNMRERKSYASANPQWSAPAPNKSTGATVAPGDQQWYSGNQTGGYSNNPFPVNQYAMADYSSTRYANYSPSFTDLIKSMSVVGFICLLLVLFLPDFAGFLVLISCGCFVYKRCAGWRISLILLILGLCTLLYTVADGGDWDTWNGSAIVLSFILLPYVLSQNWSAMRKNKLESSSALPSPTRMQPNMFPRTQNRIPPNQQLGRAPMPPNMPPPGY